LRLFPDRRVVATLRRRIAGGEASEHSQSEEYFTRPHSVPPYLSFAHWLWISACLSVNDRNTQFYRTSGCGGSWVRIYLRRHGLKSCDAFLFCLAPLLRLEWLTWGGRMPWWFGVRTGSGSQSPCSLGRQGRIALTLSFCPAWGLVGTGSVWRRAITPAVEALSR
jgi:hypothetical protein